MKLVCYVRSVRLFLCLITLSSWKIHPCAHAVTLLWVWPCWFISSVRLFVLDFSFCFLKASRERELAEGFQGAWLVCYICSFYGSWWEFQSLRVMWAVDRILGQALTGFYPLFLIVPTPVGFSMESCLMLGALEHGSISTLSFKMSQVRGLSVFFPC